MRPLFTLALVATLAQPLAADPSAGAVVPDVMGKTRAQAAAAKAGFIDPSIADVADVAGPDIADLEICFNGSHAGTVCSQDPAPGGRADKSTEIRLLVGGAATEPVATMPDLSGMTLDQARAALKKAGFTALLLSNYADRCKPTIICGQKLAAGMKVRTSSHQLVDFGR